MITTALLYLLLAAPQTITVTLPPDTPFPIQWKHPLELTTRFRLWCDSEIKKNFTSAEAVRGTEPDVAGYYTYTATAPGLPVGEHVCLVSAFDVFEEARYGEFKSEPATITMAPAPTPVPGKVHSAPIGFIILIKIPGGGGA
jgi:hypothetical protein